MEYTPQAYGKMLRRMNRGVRFRDLFFGYGSRQTHAYLSKADEERHDFENRADLREIFTRENLDLRAKLSLRIKPIWSLA